MNSRYLVVTAISVVLSVGCAETTVPDVVETIEAEPITPLVARGLQENPLEALPAVRLYNASTKSPAEGRLVLFVLQDPDSVRTTVAVRTDAAGVAKLPEWRLGRAAGRYTATTVIDGSPPIVFTVLVRGGVVAVFDLQSVDGEKLPVGYNLGLTEGHYILYEDGTYNRGYNKSAEALNETYSSGKYTWVVSQIRFFIDPGSGDGWAYRESNYQLSMGILNGAEMTVGYTNSIEFGVEVYSLRPTPSLLKER